MVDGRRCRGLSLSLQACESEVVDTLAFHIMEPTVAEKNVEKVAGMGDMSKDWGCSA